MKKFQRIANIRRLGFFCTALASLMASFAVAQAPMSGSSATSDRTALIALSSSRRIVLRWAPVSAKVWDHANRAGYVVERIRLNAAGAPESANAQRLTALPLKPWPLESWKQPVESNNMYAAIAAQALYGKAFVPKSVGPVADLKNQADEFQNRFSFSVFAADMDSVAAQGMGLRFVDNAVQPGAEYLYLVYVAPPANFRIDTAYVRVKAEATTRAAAPASLQITPGDNNLKIAWEIPAWGRAFSGYWIERSDDGGRSYRRLHKQPLVFLRTAEDEQTPPLFIDTTAVNYKKYRYRVYGITPFAMLSLPAEAEGFARDLTPPPAPMLTEGKHLRESTVQLKWKMENTSPDLTGFRLGISNSPDGPFEVDLVRLLPPDTRLATDSRALSNTKNYFVVVALDTAGNAAASMPLYVHLIDSIPPAPPLDLRAKADSSGIITIRWRLGKEPDLMGYRVYMANQENHEFNLLTGFPIADTVFVDTVKVRSLTREAYYKVVALDRNYNPSPPSQILRVRLPDVVAPVAPVLKNVTATDSSVVLFWIPSTSPDVRRHLLLRRVQGTSKWALLDTLDNVTRKYEDRQITQKVTYEYTLRAQDRSGLFSPPALPIQARPYDTGQRPGIVQLRAAPDTVRKVMRLSWVYPKSAGGEYWFVVYRGAGGEPLLRYRSAGAKTQFEDRDILGWEKFQYAVQVLYRDGGQSSISAPVEAVYRPRRRLR